MRARVPWWAAGLVAGAVAGGIDASVAVLGLNAVARPPAWWAFVLGAALLCAAAGLLVGGLVERLAWATTRPGLPPWLPAVVVALVGLPVLGGDAFALFSGHRAAELPGHQALSVALTALGTFALYLAARRWPWAARARGPSLLLVLAALGAEAANRRVLPRLYSWFHATLALATFAALLLAARSLPRPRRGRAAAALALGVIVVGALPAWRSVVGSQQARFIAFERTQHAAAVLRWLPAPAALPARPGPAIAAGPPLPEGPHHPEASVLLVTIDAMRADHVGAYGYRRATTPTVDALAAGGTRVVRAYAQAPHTSFSVTSMLTGKYVAALTRLLPGERHDTLPTVLRRYGWRTAAFYPPSVFFIDGDKLKAFDETHFDFEYVKYEYLEAERRVDQVQAYFTEVRPERSFVWLHFFEPHEPYVAHEDHPFGPRDLDRYDSEIAAVDAALGRLVGWLRVHRPATVIIVAADHGEEFDDHGGRYHGSTLYDEQLRVPFVLAGPGVPVARVLDGPVQLVDLAPTILGLLDIPAPARMRGTDLGPWLATPPAPAARLPPAFAQLDDKRAVIAGTDKAICDVAHDLCALYDLAADPREARNLADSGAPRLAALRGLLEGWRGQHGQLEPGSGGRAEEALPVALERARLGERAAMPGLLAQIASPSAPAARRREAARLAALLGPSTGDGPALATAARDADPEVADWAAVAALGAGQEAMTGRVRALAAVAQGAGDPALRVQAALALARRHDGAALEPLCAWLPTCTETALCREVIAALGASHDARAVAPLVARFDDVLTRRDAVQALGVLGRPEAVAALAARLAPGEYTDVRALAATALGRIDAPAARAALAEAARSEKEPTVQKAIEAARHPASGAGPAGPAP